MQKITYVKDIYQGSNVIDWVSYHEISKKNMKEQIELSMRQIIAFKNFGRSSSFFYLIKSDNKEFAALKIELKDQLKSDDDFRKL